MLYSELIYKKNLIIIIFFIAKITFSFLFVVCQTICYSYSVDCISFISIWSLLEVWLFNNHILIYAVSLYYAYLIINHIYFIIKKIFFRIIGYLCYYGFKACPFFDMMCVSEKEIFIHGKPYSMFFLSSVNIIYIYIFFVALIQIFFIIIICYWYINKKYSVQCRIAIVLSVH